MSEQRLAWDRWLELAALMRVLWPAADLGDDTIREWYERGAWRWDFDYTQAAITDWLEQSSFAPSFADIAGRRRDLLEAARRAQDAERRAAEAPPSPEQRAEAVAVRDAWRRIQHAMAHRSYGPRIREAVAEQIGTQWTCWNGRAQAYGPDTTRWSQLVPAWGPGEAEGIRERLARLVAECEAEAVERLPVGDPVEAVLSAWD